MEALVCPETLPGWGQYQWFYGFATEEYATFAALMAGAAATLIFVQGLGQPSAGIDERVTRKLFFSAFLALLISTTLYGEVAGEQTCELQVLAGSAASMLLAAGTALVVLALIPHVFDDETEGPVRIVFVSIILAVLAGAYLVASYSVVVQLQATFPLSLWLGIVALMVGFAALFWRRWGSTGIDVTTICITFAAVTGFTYLLALILPTLNESFSAFVLVLVLTRTLMFGILVGFGRGVVAASVHSESSPARVNAKPTRHRGTA
ncbi:MAG: hypothetical protein ACRBK7_30410 [Acidimicrobiales bacterium]